MSVQTKHILALLHGKSPTLADPVLRALVARLEEGLLVTRGGIVERFLIDRGKPFVGIPRPVGYRCGSSTSAFANAYASAVGASDSPGVYVEGLVLHRGDRELRHHAWITQDGIHAIERTWSAEATEFHYFGLAFPTLIFDPRRPWIFRGVLRSRRYWRDLLLRERLDALDDKSLDSWGFVDTS